MLKVAQSVGCARASDHVILEELFNAKFSEALKTVGKQLEFEELYKERVKFKDQIVQVIGEDLNGYKLEDAAIDFLEQTPLDLLDDRNILDAQGITKITLLTNDAAKKVGKDNLDTKMAMLEYERQEKDAEAKQRREIESTVAFQHAEGEEIKARERLRAEKARIGADRDLAIEEINRQREEKVATQNMERVLAVEEEGVKKERDLQVLAREHEVAVRQFAKDSAVESEKIEISKKVKERIAYEKSVAEEEERIADLRKLAGADRDKKARIIGAEAEAMEEQVKRIKAAEAEKEVAEFEAVKKRINADADLEVADKVRTAMIKTAEGKQHEVAAEGLGLTRVKEAEATAIERTGMAEAKVLREKMVAEAKGQEEQGMVAIRVKEADVAVTEKAGLTEATILKEKLQAEAVGNEEKGLAEARVREAAAASFEKQGLAEATVHREKAVAEATGEEQKGLAAVKVKEAQANAIVLTGQAEANAIEKKGLADASRIREEGIATATGLAEKADAMAKLDDKTRAHEEFRLEIDNRKEVALEGLKAEVERAKAQAEVLAEAFRHADIDIIGGDGAFFEQFMRAVTVGRAVDGFVDNSDTARKVLAPYLSGEQSLPNDIREILSRPALSSGNVRDMTIAAFLGHMISKADGGGKTKLSQLLEAARDMGIADEQLDS